MPATARLSLSALVRGEHSFPPAVHPTDFPNIFSTAITSSHPLLAYFNALFAAHGPQHWWPGRSRFETIVGAILTQNTSWTNVARAIRNLRRARALNPDSIRKLSSPELQSLLRPAGYFRQKTRTLQSFVNFLHDTHCGSLNRMFATPTNTLREQLLALRGIGPETADCILLYAGRHPVFVVDAYTRRILERHGFLPSSSAAKSSYEQLRAMFESQLPPDHQLFNEFHALIVRTGKHHCHKSNPDCEHCPLNSFLPLAAANRSRVAAP